jgi:hypothetical protein
MVLAVLKSNKSDGTSKIFDTATLVFDECIHKWLGTVPQIGLEDLAIEVLPENDKKGPMKLTFRGQSRVVYVHEHPVTPGSY